MKLTADEHLVKIRAALVAAIEDGCTVLYNPNSDGAPEETIAYNTNYDLWGTNEGLEVVFFKK